MRTVPALLMATALVLGGADAAADHDAPELAAPIAASIDAFTEAVRVGASAARDARDDEIDDADDAESAEAIRIRTPTGRIVVIPGGCASVGERYDALLHFHGAPVSFEKAYEKSGLDSVLLLVNLGNGSGKYESQYAGAGALEAQLQALDRVVDKACPGKKHEAGRVALSAWSAGYGAIFRILAHDANADRIDAALLADGLHAGFQKKGHRKVDPLHIAPFARFAERAARGEKLMAVTHSAIVTGNYASTTESSSYLLADNGIERVAEREDGPRKSMTQTSSASHGGLHVRGFAGTTPAAHCDHLYAMGDTVLPLLRQRWAR